MKTLRDGKGHDGGLEALWYDGTSEQWKLLNNFRTHRDLMDLLRLAAKSRQI